MFACGGLELYFHGQEGLTAIFSPYAAILEKFIFFVLGPLVGPLCTVQWARKWKRKMVNENLTDPIISAAQCLISAAMTS